MLLRNPYFLENICQDQPYMSMLLVAPFCDFTCKGCHNKDLVHSEISHWDISELVRAYKDNPFFEGITVAGLEITCSGSKFVKDLLKFIRLAGISKVTIYSREELSSSKLNFILKSIKKLDCTEEVYVKTGSYMEICSPKKVFLTENWSIELASHNQQFIRLK